MPHPSKNIRRLEDRCTNHARIYKGQHETEKEHIEPLRRALRRGQPAAIIGGEYVLESHGHILRVLAESEYLSLNYLELRCFAFWYITFSFVFTVYGWFHRGHGEAA